MSIWSAMIDFIFGLLGFERKQSEGERLGQAEVQNSDLKADNQLLKAQEQALANKEDFRDALKNHDI